MPCEMALPGRQSLAELSCIVIFQLIPWDQLSQLDPAIVAREFSSKRQEKVLKRELITMLTSVHVENSGRLLGANEPNLVHLIRENCSHPLHRSRSGFSQEAQVFQRERAPWLLLLNPKHLQKVVQLQDQCERCRTSSITPNRRE